MAGATLWYAKEYRNVVEWQDMSSYGSSSASALLRTPIPNSYVARYREMYSTLMKVHANNLLSNKLCIASLPSGIGLSQLQRLPPVTFLGSQRICLENLGRLWNQSRLAAVLRYKSPDTGPFLTRLSRVLGSKGPRAGSLANPLLMLCAYTRHSRGRARGNALG
eukprot:6211950-Pleurochrysis_carterae.AAC.2